MGRTKPSRGVPPPGSRKEARAKRAKQTLNKDIPAILQASSRARDGVESSELIRSPPKLSAKKDLEPFMTISPDQADSEATPAESLEPPQIKIQVSDTFEAASRLLKKSKFQHAKSSRVAVLNMASPLRAGGGFLNGALAQEESLCMRSTLYPALRDEFYRLPEIGGVYTSDILVFRRHGEDTEDLPKNERFFVDVVSSAMLRHPDTDEDEDGNKVYANPKDREMVEKKMRAAMRMVTSKGIRRLVLGAWGCGAYANPVKEVALTWKKVLLGGPSQQKGTESYSGMEIVFAILERPMAMTFAKFFGVEVEQQEQPEEAEEEIDDEGEAKIAELESQIASSKSPLLKERLEAILEKLKTEDE